MSLTDLAIRSARAGAKPTKLFDGGGLYVLVNPNGSKYWRWKFYFVGREQLLSLGTFPDVTLKAARLKRDAARLQLSQGINPAAERQAKRQNVKLAATNTFEAIAREFLDLQAKKLAAITLGKARWMLETFVYPEIGNRPLPDLRAPEILRALRKIEDKGLHETAHRTRARIGQICRYAIATGRAERDPTADLRGALAPAVTKSHAAITDPQALGQLLRAIDGLSGFPPAMAALRLAPLWFVRPGELRKAEWSEIDFDAKQWRIPGPKMKMREPHVVPLARQAIAILRDLEPVTGAGRYCFPSLRSADRPMSENTVTAALRRLGYGGDTMTGHGFRATASTRLNELGFDPDVIERQLAHAERNKVRAVYNRAQYMAERTKMMQAWADYLDALRTGTPPKKSGTRR